MSRELWLRVAPSDASDDSEQHNLCHIHVTYYPQKPGTRGPPTGQQAHDERRVQTKNPAVQNAEGAFPVPNLADADVVVTITKLHPHPLPLLPP
jgi:hypothetical protein